MEFRCRNCSYRFKSVNDATKKKCPYCNTEGVMFEPGAQELIDEA